MKINGIKIRDPFIYADKESGTYYLYRSHYVQYAPNVRMSEIVQKFECFVSHDLIRWDGPFCVFEPGETFWGKYDFWAPEVHRYNGSYYLIATFNSDSHTRACHILKADNPQGPFKPITELPITPAKWESLDGTLYVDRDQQPWLVFCHEWLQIEDGSIEAMQLADDLSLAKNKPKTLLNASCQSWAAPITSGVSTGLVTDGPFIYESIENRLIMIWSTFSQNGYAIAQARANSINGPWEHAAKPLLNSDGGHGMIFRTFENQLMLAVHSPNSPYRVAERLKLIPVIESDGWLVSLL